MIPNLLQFRPRTALLAYAVGGLALGFCNRPLNLIALRYGIRPGIGTALNVNVLMPLMVAALAILHRRVGFAWIGAIIATLLFYLAMNLVQHPSLAQWSPRAAITGIHPILVMACIGYGVVGTIAALIAAAMRTHPR